MAATTPWTAIVLSAGLGTRMRSALPKAMHRLAGLPLCHYPVQAALDAGASEVVVVVGHGRALVEQYLSSAFGARVKTALQHEQRGTGDAARAGLDEVSRDSERVLILNGDGPLVNGGHLTALLEALDHDPTAAIAMATCTLDNPRGYGRIVRDALGHIVAIREDKDLRSDAERAIGEINPGMYAGSAAFFREVLPQLSDDNAQKELYLTDTVALAADAGSRVLGIVSPPEVMEGVNDRHQLALAEAKKHAQIAEAWRKSGVTVRESARIDASVVVEEDATIEHGVVLRGRTHVGRGARIDVGSVLTHVNVAAEAVVKPYTVAEDSSIGVKAQVGPFSHLRPGSQLGEEVHIGNFVETKKTVLGKGSKANHLAYLGDGVIGERVNVGAGTIFCNYDGVRKHTTVLEDDAFIGSDSQLVAPITVGKGAYVGTGSTVTKDVPANALAIGRARQENKDGYASRLRALMTSDKKPAAGGSEKK